jgi:predicted amidohydrolase
MRAGYWYHNQWWIPHDRDGIFEMKGLFGQHMHISPAAELVIIIKLSTHPAGDTSFTHDIDRRAFAAVRLRCAATERRGRRQRRAGGPPEPQPRPALSSSTPDSLGRAGSQVELSS